MPRDWRYIVNPFIACFGFVAGLALGYVVGRLYERRAAKATQ